MSEMSLAVKCDGVNCGKKSFDYIRDGWIIHSGGLTLYEGRKSNGDSETGLFHAHSKNAKHFCSWKCFGVKP